VGVVGVGGVLGVGVSFFFFYARHHTSVRETSVEGCPHIRDVRSGEVSHHPAT